MLPTSHPWPETFPLSNPPALFPLIRRSRNSPPPQPQPAGIHHQCYDNRADDTEITLMPLFHEAILSCLKTLRPAAGSWKDTESVVTWTWHFHPRRDAFVLRYAVKKRTKCFTMIGEKKQFITTERWKLISPAVGSCTPPGWPLREWVNPLLYCFKHW